MTIFFDMDGTIADLYGIPTWLDSILAEDTHPYDNAAPLLRFAAFARILNRLQRDGYHIGIITWLAKGGSSEYNNKVTESKRRWLRKHLPSVVWDELHITEYGVPKEQFCRDNDILFDDNAAIREAWTGSAFDVSNIMDVLKTLQ